MDKIRSDRSFKSSMDDQVATLFEPIRTKLAPPRLPAHPVGLDRCRAWVPKILTHRITLVRAESGYGKSTFCAALYQHFVAQGIRSGWVSFDSNDDDRTRAISYVIAAVNAALDDGSATGFEEGWRYDGLIPPHSVATRLINALLDVGEPIVLFLDDPDRMTDPPVLQFLNYLLLHGPDNLRLVLSCQSQPALPFRHLDERGQLLRIGAEDLRLSDDEALRLLSGDEAFLNAGEIRRLNAAMGGWVTGLRIGSAAMRNNRDALNDIGLVRHAAQWLSDYLDDHIFQHMTPLARRFLTAGAIVEQMTAPLCAVLSGTTTIEATQMLSRLADQNLFVQRLDEASARFRIHPVFRTFLLNKLALDDVGAAARLHRIASDWFARQGQTASSITHALDGGDTAGAAAMIDTMAMGMVERSEIVTLLGWIARLPEDALNGYRQARIAQAWALALSLRPQARAVLDSLRAEVAQAPVTDAADDLRGQIAGIETIFLAVVEDRIDEAVTQGYAFLARPRDEGSFVTRAVRNAVAFCEYIRGRHDVVHDLVLPAQLHARKAEQIFPTAYRYCILGMTYRAQGQLDDAERTFRDGLTLAERVAGPQSVSSALIASFLARSLYERGDFDGATALLDQRLPTIDATCFCEATINAYLVSVRCLARSGAIDKAAALIEQAEMIGHERGWPRLLATCVVERARLGLVQTLSPDRLLPIDTETAALAAPMALPARTAAILFEARAYEAIAAGDAARTAAVSERLAGLASQAKCHDLRLKSVVIGLLPHLHGITPQDRVEDGTAAILDAAVKGGFRRTIADMVEARIRTGIDARPTPGLPAQVAEILARASLDYAAFTASEPVTAPASISVFQLLTSREIDVMTALSRGESNKLIARRLHLTPETVKWHLRNIMRKLDSDSRAEAVAKAAALGLSLAQD